MVSVLSLSVAARRAIEIDVLASDIAENASLATQSDGHAGPPRGGRRKPKFPTRKGPKKSKVDGGGAVMAGVGLLKDTLVLIKEPNVQNGGNFLVAAAGIAAMIPAPPASLVVAGLLGVTGVFMQVFGEGKPEVTNEDIMDAMKKGFKKVDMHLSLIEDKIDELQEQVKVIDDYIRLGRKEMEDILAYYRKYISLLQLAESDDFHLKEAHDLAIKVQKKFGQQAYGVFQPPKVDELLKKMTSCRSAFYAYQDIIAARTALYTMIVDSQITRHGVDGAVVKASELLYHHVLEYNKSIEKYNVPLTETELLCCEASRGYSWTNILNPACRQQGIARVRLVNAGEYDKGRSHRACTPHTRHSQ